MKKQVVINNEVVDVDVIEQNANFVLFKIDGEEYGVKLESSRDGKLVLNYNQQNSNVVNSNNVFVVNGAEIEVALPNRSRSIKSEAGAGGMISPMPGKILKIFVKVGDIVKKGDAIIVMEAMKMEHTIKAANDGKIDKLFYKEGEQVPAKVELVVIC